MATNKSGSDGSSEFNLLGFVACLIVIALFGLVSTRAGTRALGVYMIAGAVIQQWRGQIEYGWEGRPPSGYITGWAATTFNLAFGVLGLGTVIWPEVVMGILGWDKE